MIYAGLVLGLLMVAVSVDDPVRAAIGVAVAYLVGLAIGRYSRAVHP